MEKGKIKLVVLDDHTLGYILPQLPNDVQILHTSPLKGSPTTSNLTSSFPIGTHSNVRLASENDFNDFGVYFEGYKNDNSSHYAK